MESDVFRVSQGSTRVLKTVPRMPGTFIGQLYAVDLPVACWVSLGSISYAVWAFFLYCQHVNTISTGREDQTETDVVSWTYQVQTVAFGAVLLLNVLNLGMRQHLLPFKCNLLLLYINGVAFVTDLLLWRGASPVVLSSAGRAFAPLRYVQWCHSTPTMIYMVALLADQAGRWLAAPLACDVAMVLTGLAACYTAGPLKALMTLLSFVTFAVVLWFVYGLFQRTISGDVSAEQRCTLRTVLGLLLALWSAFPAVWLAAELQLLSPAAEAVAWGVCDYLAKVVFNSQLWQSNLTGVQGRRDRALEAWEASNRVEAVARLTALLRQRDDLLSTLSHELRTPLAGIVALTGSTCKDASAAPPGDARTLATVRAAATCMLSIVTATLDSFAGHRGESGLDGLPPSDGATPPGADGDAAAAAAVRQLVPVAAVDLRQLVDTVTSVLRPLAHDGVTVVTDVPGGLPLVAADATRLSQVLYNLVGNAMRFTSHGEIRVTARVLLPEGADTAAPAASAGGSEPADSTRSPARASCSGGGGGAGVGLWRRRARRPSSSSASSAASATAAAAPLPPGSQVEILVEDTGVGIPQETLDELFQPYRTGGPVLGESGSAAGASAAGAARKRRLTPLGGTGLGLYLVRLALRSQGSDIVAESIPNLGSTFRFRLPVAADQREGAAHAHAHAQAAQRQEQQLLLTPAERASGLPGAGDEVGGAVSGQVAAAGQPVDAFATNARLDALSTAAEERPRSAPAQPTPSQLKQQEQQPDLDERRQQRQPGTPRGTGTGMAATLQNPAPPASTGAAATAAAAGPAPHPASGPSVDGIAKARAAQPTGSNYRHRNKGNLQIMSVDDDPINQLVAGQMMTSQSWKVVKCMNGPEALKHLHLPAADASTDGDGGAGAGGLAAAVAAAAAAEPVVLPDCMLLDVMMPGMSGFEVCRRLRERYSTAQLPVIIVSAKGDAAAVEEAFAAGADDYISKPYKRAEMVARIRAQIRIRDSLREAAPPAVAAAEAEAEGKVEKQAGAEGQGGAAAPAPAHPAVDARPTTRVALVSDATGATPTMAAAPGLISAPLPPSFATAFTAAGSSGPLFLCSPRLQPRAPGGRSAAAPGLVSAGWPTPFTPPAARVGAAQPTLYKRCSSMGNGDALAAGRSWQLIEEASAGLAATPVSPCPSPLVAHEDVGLGGVRLGSDGAHQVAGAGSGASIPTLRNVAVVDAGVGTSTPLPVITVRRSTAEGPASSPAVASTAAATFVDTTPAGGADGEPTAALLREVLLEVRRSQRLEAEVSKLTARLATLQTSCGSLAADRDGWRRQARELRALLAAGLRGAAPAHAGSASVDGMAGGRGGLYGRLLTAEQVRLDSGRYGASGPGSVGGGVAGAGNGGRSDGSSASSGGEGGGETVETQLEDLKREAALLRQQLSIALASVGTGAGGADAACRSSGYLGVLNTDLDLALRCESSAPSQQRAGPAAEANGCAIAPAGAAVGCCAVARRAPGMGALPEMHEMVMATNASEVSAMSGGPQCTANGMAEPGGNGHLPIASSAVPVPAAARAHASAVTASDPSACGLGTSLSLRQVLTPPAPQRAASGGDATAEPPAQAALSSQFATSISEAHVGADDPNRVAAATGAPPKSAANVAASDGSSSGAPGGLGLPRPQPQPRLKNTGGASVSIFRRLCNKGAAPEAK